MIERHSLVSELQQLRESIGFLHNHKEQSAYSIFAVIVAGTSWASTENRPLLVLLLLLVGSSALHFMMRFQLKQRLHCAQFYRVYFASIRRVLTMSNEEVEQIVVVTSNPSLRSEISLSTTIIGNVLWSRREIILAAERNYPAFSVVDEEIMRTTDYYLKSGVPLIEKVPTLGSLGCIMFIFGKVILSNHFVHAVITIRAAFG